MWTSLCRRFVVPDGPSLPDLEGWEALILLAVVRQSSKRVRLLARKSDRFCARVKSLSFLGLEVLIDALDKDVLRGTIIADAIVVQCRPCSLHLL